MVRNPENKKITEPTNDQSSPKNDNIIELKVPSTVPEIHITCTESSKFRYNDRYDHSNNKIASVTTLQQNF